MKKKPAFTFCLLLCFLSVNAQQNVGIGTTTPDASAILDISSINKGVRLPNVQLTNVNSPSPIVNPVIGLLVWNTNASIANGSGVGFYYWEGTTWHRLFSSFDGEGWKLAGNSGTNPSTHFIGTTDNQPLRFRVNNLSVGTINPALFNTFLGAGTGTFITPGFEAGQRNILIGDSAGFTLTTGQENSFMGFRSGYSNVSGSHNTFIGSRAGELNSSGDLNTFIGAFSGKNNTTGTLNTFVGGTAGINNNTGLANSFYGYAAGQENRTGEFNSFFGYDAGLRFNSNGNSFFGASAGFGSAALTGNDNSAFGRQAAQGLSSGTNNSVFGAHSGFSITSGSNNTFIGDSAGYNTTIGSFNTFIGKDAGLNNTVSANSFFGYQAGMHNNAGSHNSYFGHMVGAIQSGSNNSLFGANVAFISTIGTHNAIFGSHAGNRLSSGSRNSFFGSHSGYSTTNGNSNVFVGDSTGHSNLSGGNNTLIGAQADLAGTSLSNATAIGCRAVAGENNVVVIGSINGINGAASSVNVGIGLISPARPLHVSGTPQTTGLAPMPDAVIVAEKLNDDAYLNILTNADQTSGIGFGNDLHAADGGIVYNSGSNTYDLRFRTNGNVDRVTIDSNGRMGIGTMSPTARLDVIGTVKLGTTGSVLNAVIRATVSFNVPSLAQGDSYTETITVTGAAANGTVHVSPNADLPGGLTIAFARASAPNTVRVKFTNAGNTVLPISSLTLFITAIQ